MSDFISEPANPTPPAAPRKGRRNLDEEYEASKRFDGVAMKAEEKRFGPPRFHRLFAAQDPPEKFTIEVDDIKACREALARDPDCDISKLEPITGWVEVRRLPDHDLKMWQNAGEEVSLVDDKKTSSGTALRMVRSLNEESETLMNMAVVGWEIPNGERDDKNQPFIRRHQDYGSDRARLDFFRSLDPDIASFIEDCCRIKQGLSGKRGVSAVPWLSSSGSSTGNTAG